MRRKNQRRGDTASEGFGFCMLSHWLLGALIGFLLPEHSKEIIFYDSCEVWQSLLFLHIDLNIQTLTQTWIGRDWPLPVMLNTYAVSCFPAFTHAGPPACEAHPSNFLLPSGDILSSKRC